MKINFFKKSKEIKSKKTRADLIRELVYDEDHGYSLLRSSITLNEDSEFEMEVAKNTDSYGYMSQDLGEELDSLFLDKNYIVGIHRTGYAPMDSNILYDIFNKGLINNGHVMQGVNGGWYDLENTVTLFNEFTYLNHQLKAAHGYKGSEGCIIVRIPKSYLGRADGEAKPIFYKRADNDTRLLPEFVYGYIPVEGSKVKRIIKNPNYKNEHTYDNEGLYYDDSAYYKAKREGIDLYNQNATSLNQIYSVLIEAYNQTLLKYGDKQAEAALINLINNNNVTYFTGKENREFLSKNISPQNVLKIISMASPSQNLSINEIIINFQNAASNIPVGNKTIK